jgi:hypothetical protein
LVLLFVGFGGVDAEFVILAVAGVGGGGGGGEEEGEEKANGKDS